MKEENQSEEDILNAVRKLARQKPNFDLVDRAEILTQNIHEIDRKIEALLFSSKEPISAQMLVSRLGEGEDIGASLARLKRHYIGRGVNLVEIAGGWRFQTAQDIAPLLEEQKEEPRKNEGAAAGAQHFSAGKGQQGGCARRIAAVASWWRSPRARRPAPAGGGR